MNRGQTVVELLVALGIAAVVIVALIIGAVTALANITFARKQAEATRLSREGLEWLRTERDAGWSVFQGRSGKTWCLSALGWSRLGSCSSGATVAGSDLYREVQLVTLSSTEIEATVMSYWNDGKGRHEAKLGSRFTNWR